MTSAADRYMAIARRWFSEGWTGNLALAEEIFSEDLRTNGVSTSIVDTFVSGDKLAVVLIGRGTHTGPYGGVPATGRPVEVRDQAVWRFRDGQVIEISTLQDQFGMLKQIGYLPDDVRAA
jgi:predicted ester cyclase